MGDQKKILAADDDPSVLSLLEKRLKAAGYDVKTADGGKAVLEIAGKEKPALIILDILMPDMDGSETAAALKNDPVTKDIPILFLTCLYTKREEKKETGMASRKFFLAKPYDPKELLEKIEGIIGR